MLCWQLYQQLPMLASKGVVQSLILNSSTGWIGLAEKSFPELLPHLSSCKSPQGMMGSMIKTYFAQQIGKKPEDMVFVSFMPCVRKQGEADRDLDTMHSACPADGMWPRCLHNVCSCT
jgi:iron only hydrogenase large subunit-like protein